MFFAGVLTSVQFDNQLGLRTEEIGNVGTDRMLATEAKPFDLFAAEYRP
jgi:hypothetical protein